VLFYHRAAKLIKSLFSANKKIISPLKGTGFVHGKYSGGEVLKRKINDKET